MAFPTGWTKKQTLIIDKTKVSGTTNLTDFPVLVSDGNLLDTVYTDAPDTDWSFISLVTYFYSNSFYITESVTVPETSANHCLILAISAHTSYNGTLTDVKYNGVSMTMASHSSISNGAYYINYIFYLMNPDIGTHDIKITNTGTMAVYANVILYDGIDATNPIDKTSSNNGLGTTAQADITTGNNVFIFGYCNSASSSVSTGLTQRDKKSYITSGDSNGYVNAGIHSISFSLDSSGSWLTSTASFNLVETRSDLRFTSDISGKTELPFEIVSFDKNAKTSEIWVKIPIIYIGSDTLFYVWWGNASATAYARTDTYGSDNVWGSNYKAVYHAGEARGNLLDSTSNGNDLTDNNTVGSGVGKIGNGRDFVAANSENFDITDAAQTGLDITGDLHWSGWVKFATSPSSVTLLNKWGVDQRSYSIEVRTGILYWRNSSNGIAETSASVSWTPSTGTLYRLDYFYDASAGSISFYVNGVQQGTTQTGLPTSIFNSSSIFSLGAESSVAAYMNGIIDEARICSSLPTADWIATEYNNQNSPSTFITGSTATSYNNIIRNNIYRNNGIAEYNDGGLSTKTDDNII